MENEQVYLVTLKNILENGEICSDRTGVGTKSMFGIKMDFDLVAGFPLLTTKKVLWRYALHELLWMIRGDTNTKHLEDVGVHYWKANTSRDFLDKRGLEWEEGDMGPGYGFQWRHWGTSYTGCQIDYTGCGFDQLTELVHGIQNDPHGRRHILTSWNCEDISKMALPPCHLLAQFHVSGDKQFIDCMLLQRSGDMFLGVPFNMIMYAMLTHMIGYITGLIPRKLVHVIGDAHIYLNHMDAVGIQLSRSPKIPPRFQIDIQNDDHRNVKSIDDFIFSDFNVTGYDPQPFIPAKMAV